MTTLRRLAGSVGARLRVLGPLALLLVAASGVAWFGWVFVPDQREAAIDGWRRDLSVRADLRRDLLDRRIRNLTDDVSFVAAFPTVRALATPGLTPEEVSAEAGHLHGILSDFQRTYRQESASILDASGGVLVTAGDSTPGRASVALARRVARAGLPGVDLVRRSDGRARLSCAAPVAGPGGAVAGAVLAEGDAALLFDLLEHPVARSSAESLLVRVEGGDVLFLSPTLFRPDPPLTVRLPLATAGLAARAALTEPDSFGEFVDYRGVRILAAVRRLAGAPWGLVVKVDRDEALAPFRREMRQRGISWGALLLAISAAAFASWRTLVTSQDLALARSEARFRDLFEQANDAVLIVGRDRRILETNRAAEEAYGCSREALVGRDVADFRPESERAVVRDRFAQADLGLRLVFEGEHLRADGSRFQAEVSTRLVDGPGEPVHLSIVRDVTARKASENRIRHLNRLLRTISEVNQLLVRVADEDALLRDVCRILASHGGYALAWIGRAEASKRVVPVASAGRAVAYLDGIDVRWDDTPGGRGPSGTCIREGRPVVVQDLEGDAAVEPWRDRMRAYGFRSDAALPIRRGGAVTQCLTVYSADEAFVDAEELALLEELVADIAFALDSLDARAALRRREAELRKVWRAVEQTPAAVLITDLAGRIEYANPCFTEVTGYGAREVLGQNPRFLKSGRTPPETFRDLWSTVRSGGVWQGELCNRKKDGSLYWARVSISPVRDESGSTTHYVGVEEDVTLEKQAAKNLAETQEQLQQAQRMEAVGRLAGGVAHDFNNLLTVIQGYGELLATSLEPDPERRETAGEIVKAAERASALTRQLLAFSRRQVLETRILDLGAVIAETERMLRRLIGEDVELAVTKPGSLGRVQADPGQVEQVVLNLAVNARDAMPAGGRLTIALADADLRSDLPAAPDVIPAGRYVVLSMTDTGTGMDGDTLSHVFEPFFTTKERGKGTGLGLATVYGIVRQSGGYVAVESAPGKGTTFRVYLPRCEEQASSGERAAALPANGDETVLLVEDEPAVRNLARVVLERHGYTVLAAENGEAALALLARDPRVVDVLLTDLVMPGMNGRDLASRVTSLRPSVRVVFMSGYAADVVTSVDAAGETGFLAKPFNERALAAKVREVLDAPPPPAARRG